jgi:hypothetical protein
LSKLLRLMPLAEQYSIYIHQSLKVIFGKP